MERWRSSMGFPFPHHHEILKKGHLWKDPDDLISPAHPSPGDLIRLLSRDLLTAEIDMSLVRLKNPGDEVEEGRLSSAIGTDQAGDRSGLDIKRTVVQGHHFSKLFHHIIDS